MARTSPGPVRALVLALGTLGTLAGWAALAPSAEPPPDPTVAWPAPAPTRASAPPPDLEGLPPLPEVRAVDTRLPAARPPDVLTSASRRWR